MVHISIICFIIWELNEHSVSIVCQSLSTKYCVHLNLIINELDQIMKCFKCAFLLYLNLNILFYFILFNIIVLHLKKSLVVSILFCDNVWLNIEMFIWIEIITDIFLMH